MSSETKITRLYKLHTLGIKTELQYFFDYLHDYFTPVSMVNMLDMDNDMVIAGFDLFDNTLFSFMKISGYFPFNFMNQLNHFEKSVGEFLLTDREMLEYRSVVESHATTKFLSSYMEDIICDVIYRTTELRLYTLYIYNKNGYFEFFKK